mgnify:CR=1 FL=1
MIAEGDIILAALPHADGTTKLRPVLLLRKLPGFGDFLVCGVSSQLRHAIEDFDLVLMPSSSNFQVTGLKVASVFRLTHLAVLPSDRMKRRLGVLSSNYLKMLQTRLSSYLIQKDSDMLV